MARTGFESRAGGSRCERQWTTGRARTDAEKYNSTFFLPASTASVGLGTLCGMGCGVNRTVGTSVE